jgi:hypothetical protein
MNKLETLKCVEVTSQRQADNGTISYFDPQTGVYYNLYENGYVRRSFGRKRLSNGRLSDEVIYQLNPKRKGTYVSPYSGQTFDCVERVMLESHVERMDCAARAVVNYRNTNKKYAAQRASAAQRLKEQREDREMQMIMSDIHDSIYQFQTGHMTFSEAINNINSAVKDAQSFQLSL